RTVVHENELLRHSVYTRVLHWTVAAFFVLALLSGFAIYTPWLYRWLTPLFGGGPQTRLLHPWFSLGFVLVFTLQVLNWLRPMTRGTVDQRWAWTRHPGWYRRATGRDPRADHARAEERANARAQEDRSL